MDYYQYCPSKNYAVEIDNLSLELDASLTRKFFKASFTNDMLVQPDVVEFNLQHQFTLHLCPYINGVLRYENGDSVTFNSNVSAATLATSKTAPFEPIHYLVPPSALPFTTSVSGENETPTILMNDPTNKADVFESLPPPSKTQKTSEEDTLNNRLEESGKN